MKHPLGVSFQLNGDIADSARKTVCVVGNPRGGTSMVAGILRIMGVSMGSEIDEANNEDQTVIRLRDPVTVLIDKNHKDHDAKIKQLLQYFDGHGEEVWGWKDPLSYEYVEEISDFLPNLAIIVVMRDIVATAIRENAETSLEINQSIRDAAHRYLRITAIIPQMPVPSLWISYDKALRHKYVFLNDLSTFLGIPLAPDTIERCVQFIEPNRGHATI